MKFKSHFKDSPLFSRYSKITERGTTVKYILGFGHPLPLKIFRQTKIQPSKIKKNARPLGIQYKILIV